MWVFLVHAFFFFLSCSSFSVISSSCLGGGDARWVVLHISSPLFIQVMFFSRGSSSCGWVHDLYQTNFIKALVKNIQKGLTLFSSKKNYILSGLCGAVVLDGLQMQTHSKFDPSAAKTKSHCSAHHGCGYVCMKTRERACRGLHLPPGGQICVFDKSRFNLLFLQKKYIQKAFTVLKYFFNNCLIK